MTTNLLPDKIGKNIQNNNKKKLLEHKEFVSDLTNLDLTIFSYSNLPKNNLINKSFDIIKANIKNRERSREKSLLKENRENYIKIEKYRKNELKIPKKYRVISFGKIIIRKKNNRKVLIDIGNYSKNNKLDNKNEFFKFKLEYDNNKENNQNIQNNIYIYEKSDEKDILENEIIQNKKELSNLNNNNLLSNNKINNKYDLQYEEDYQEEFIFNMILIENKIRINPFYMLKQNDINEKMRFILLNWLIEVH